MFRSRRMDGKAPHFLGAVDNHLSQDSSRAAAIEEFRALRDEVRSRLEKQQEITSYAIAFMAAIAVAASFLSREKSGLERLAPAYPLISIVLSGFTLMTLDHDMNIAHIYNYIDTRLRPRLNSQSKDSEDWGWNEYRAQRQQGGGLRNTFFTGPSRPVNMQ